MMDAHDRDAERVEATLQYWRGLARLERKTIAYAAYHGFEPALRLIGLIIDKIKPPIMPPIAWMRDDSHRHEWEADQRVYAMARLALLRNKPGIRLRIRRFLRSL